jgi:hypothetical protein
MRDGILREIMRDGILDEEILEENQTDFAAPRTLDEFIVVLSQDVILNHNPNELASEFMKDFVQIGRPEAAQVLAMLETPAEGLVVMVKGLLEQSFIAQSQAVDNFGFDYFERLKAAVKKKMTAMAEQ